MDTDGDRLLIKRWFDKHPSSIFTYRVDITKEEFQTEENYIINKKKYEDKGIFEWNVLSVVERGFVPCENIKGERMIFKSGDAFTPLFSKVSVVDGIYTNYFTRVRQEERKLHATDYNIVTFVIGKIYRITHKNEGISTPPPMYEDGIYEGILVEFPYYEKIPYYERDKNPVEYLNTKEFSNENGPLCITININGDNKLFHLYGIPWYHSNYPGVQEDRIGEDFNIYNIEEVTSEVKISKLEKCCEEQQIQISLMTQQLKDIMSRSAIGMKKPGLGIRVGGYKTKKSDSKSAKIFWGRNKNT